MSRPRRYDRGAFGVEETTGLRATIVVVALALTGWSSALADRIEAGHEGQVRAASRKAAPTWASFQDDNLGNLTVVVGSGKPALLLVAHMDEPGYVVSGVTEQGYLKVQRLARIPFSPLFDQSHMGQPLLVQTRRGVIPAVAVVHSTHLWRGNAAPLAHAILDEDLFVDIGARSPGEVEGAGVALLAPVVIARRIVDLAGGKVAGPA